MKIKEIMNEDIFDNLSAAKDAFQGARQGGQGFLSSLGAAKQQYGVGQAVGAEKDKVKRYANQMIQRWNQAVAADPSQNTVAGLTAFVKRNVLPHFTEKDPNLTSIKHLMPPADPRGFLTDPKAVSAFIELAVGKELAYGKIGQVPGAAEIPPEPSTDNTQQQQQPPAPTTQQPPIQVRVLGHGIITKGPDDDKWRDEQGDIISRPEDIAELEKRALTQRQNRQMAPGRSPDVTTSNQPKNKFKGRKRGRGR